MLDALTLGQIRTFVAIAEAGSFRAGAARLLRAQSAVSHAIATLEAQLGLTLFDRSGHRPTLTPEGCVLLEDARAILLKVDFMRARARGFGEGLELELPLVVDTLFPLPLAAAALRELSQELPAVRVRLSVAPLGAPLAALQERACKLAITVGGDFRDPRIELETLMSLRFVAVVAASHPLGQRAGEREAVRSAELAEHLQIVLEDPSPLSEGRDFGVLSPRTWRVSGQDTKLAFILGGVGWGRLPLWAVERDLAEGRLVRVPATALGEQGETTVLAYLAHRIDDPLGPAARALRENLLRHAGARGR
ncbi:LysR family transcriptional regulator [Zestomonas carbonaria]|uniref:HTH-type transcriptional regulator YhaJ n=1 Tax=Zestomonas carbonaria TaxID=2762745 RepID=A0A7U7IA40_9GAMM|nr:LysR family transcriptional regulator [Pseudomonas carbonaria]CAD5108411.1 HTH-type transcriptional regulator YhaJ [Pseudomonas carbonaria]